MSTVGEPELSLADFRAAAAETLERVNRTMVPEFITVDGEVRGVLMPPEFYRVMARVFWLEHDVAMMRRSLQQYEAGEYQPAREVFDELHAKLLAMKAAQEQGQLFSSGTPSPE